MNSENSLLKQKTGALEAELDRRVSEAKGLSNKDVVVMISQLENKLRAKERELAEANNALLEAKAKHEDEICGLKDEIDLNRDLELQLSNAEVHNELYRKQIEELAAFKKIAKEAQQLNETLRNQISDLHGSPSEILTTKQNLMFYRESFAAEQEKNADLVCSLEERGRLLRENSRKIKSLEDDQKQLKEELRGCKRDLDRDSHLDSLSCSDLSAALATGLEEQIIQLEIENKALKAQCKSSGLLEGLNAQTNSALIAKKSAEENLRKQTFTNKELTHSLEETKEQLARSSEELKSAQQQAALYQMQLFELDKVERDSHNEDIRKVFLEKDQLTAKLLDAKDSLCEQQNLLFQSESTVKSLQKDNLKLKSKLKTAKTALDTTSVKRDSADEYGHKIQCLELQRDLHKLENELTGLRHTLKEKENLLVKAEQEKTTLEAELNESLLQQETALSASYETAAQGFTKQLEQKDSELSSLVQLKDEIAATAHKELKTMSVIVHSVGLEIMRVNRTMKDTRNYLEKRKA